MSTEQTAAQGPQGGRPAHGHARLPAALSGRDPGVRRDGRRLGPLCTADLPAGPCAGIDEFDVEIWNELTFGTRFLDINNYYDKAAPEDRPRTGLPEPRRQLLGTGPADGRGRQARVSPSPVHLGLLEHDVLSLPRSPSSRRGPTGKAIIPTAPARGACRRQEPASGPARLQPGTLHADARHPHARGLGAHVRSRPSA